MSIRTMMRVLMLALLPVLTHAQPAGIDPEEIKALKTYCKADIERLCSGIEPGEGRIKACLMEKKEQMSVGCAQALQKLKKSAH